MKKDLVDININEDGHVECPICGYNYTHLQGYTPYYDDGRLSLALIFQCEHIKNEQDKPHCFRVNVWQHEGCTYLKGGEV